ncbi:MAG: NYN domain-containing protein [Dehalococcoidia bacterium]
MSLLIIDGNNVMGARPRTRWWRDRAGAAATLRDDIAGADLDAERVLLVFDGSPPSDSAAEDGLEVRYAGLDGCSADDLIVTLVGEVDDSEVTVVTSDRELVTRVSALGARVEGAGAFLRRTGLTS